MLFSSNRSLAIVKVPRRQLEANQFDNAWHRQKGAHISTWCAGSLHAISS